MRQFKEYLAKDRRLVILRLLKECGGSANDSIIHNGLEQLGHGRNPRSIIRDDLSFLEKAGLLKQEWYGQVIVCDITSRGIEVTEGRIEVEGVKLPSIGD